MSNWPVFNIFFTPYFLLLSRYSYQSLKNTISETKYLRFSSWINASYIELKIYFELRWFIAYKNPAGLKFMFLSSSSVLSQKASKWGWNVTKNSSSVNSHWDSADYETTHIQHMNMIPNHNLNGILSIERTISPSIFQT